MSRVTIPVSADPTLAAWQQLFLAHVLPVVEEVSRFRFRKLPHVEQEEAMAEAVACALISFVRATKRGRKPQEFASKLARFAVLRVSTGRLSSSPDRCRDLFSRFGRQQRGITLHSLDADAVEIGNGWRAVLVEDRRCTPADVAITRIDFGAWLSGMTSRRRQIAEALAAGFRTEEVAQLFNLSRGRISQMRREFEANWREFQHETHPPVASEFPAAA